MFKHVHSDRISDRFFNLLPLVEGNQGNDYDQVSVITCREHYFCVHEFASHRQSEVFVTACVTSMLSICISVYIYMIGMSWLEIDGLSHSHEAFRNKQTN